MKENIQKFVLSFLISLLMSSVLTGGAEAHALIKSSEPVINGVVHDSKIAVFLHFNSRIDQSRSKLVLYKPDSTNITLPIQPENRPEIISSFAKDLTAGNYRLRWQVLSVDGHITRGDIPFSVKP
jgi:hypothetical protein